MITWWFQKFRHVYRFMTHNDSPKQLAVAVAFGVLLGLVPKGNLLAIGISACFLAIQANLATGMLVALAFSFVASALDGVFDNVGHTILTAPVMQEFFLSVYQLPFAPWTAFNNTVVCGSLLIGLIAFYPTYRLSLPVFTRWRLRRTTPQKSSEKEPQQPQVDSADVAELAPTDESLLDDANAANTSSDDTLTDSTTRDEILTDESLTGETTFNEPSAAGTSSDSTPRDDALTGETSTNETSTNETLSDETLSDETLSDETLSDETLSDETLSDETLTDSTPRDDAPTDGKISDGKSADDTPSDSTPSDESLAATTSFDSTPSDDRPPDDASSTNRSAAAVVPPPPPPPETSLPALPVTADTRGSSPAPQKVCESLQRRRFAQFVAEVESLSRRRVA
jgi:uncharacterized protein (TIGR03546 family)